MNKEILIGQEVLVNSYNDKNHYAIVVDIYDPEEENDPNVEPGEVFWIRRKDNLQYKYSVIDSFRNYRMQMAYHKEYLTPISNKPQEWDTEENQ